MLKTYCLFNSYNNSTTEVLTFPFCIWENLVHREVKWLVGAGKEKSGDTEFIPRPIWTQSLALCVPLGPSSEDSKRAVKDANGYLLAAQVCLVLVFRCIQKSHQNSPCFLFFFLRTEPRSYSSLEVRYLKLSVERGIAPSFLLEQILCFLILILCLPNAKWWYLQGPNLTFYQLLLLF